MKTLILGASTNPSRYSYLATKRLLLYGHDVVLVGKEEGNIEGHQITKIAPILPDIDTVTLYLGPSNQVPYYKYLVEQIHPRRIIFNPGSENNALLSLAEEAGILTEHGCTLVMLSTNSY